MAYHRRRLIALFEDIVDIAGKNCSKAPPHGLTFYRDFWKQFDDKLNSENHYLIIQELRVATHYIMGHWPILALASALGAEYTTLCRGIKARNLLITALWANVGLLPTPSLLTGRIQTMPKKTEQPGSFETALKELEQIVIRLESGALPLELALNEFEQGVQLARQGQKTLQQAEQRVQILLNDTPDARLAPFTPENDAP